MREYIAEHFSEIYTHFRGFQQNIDYRQYWDKCIEAVSDEQLLSHIVFCNDVFCIWGLSTIYTSGHADESTIVKLIRRVNPAVLIPVHTENAARFREIAPGVTIEE